MEINSLEAFETRDLWIAAYLRTMGVVLEDSRNDHGNYYFIFSDINNCEQLVSEYFQGALVPAIELKSSINFFKDRIFSG